MKQHRFIFVDEPNTIVSRQRGTVQQRKASLLLAWNEFLFGAVLGATITSLAIVMLVALT